MSPRLSASEFFLKAHTDERLVALSREGHGRAFAVLVDRHRRALLGHASRMVGRDRGEDVLQQTLLNAWSSLQGGTQVRHAQAWLHRILHNAALTEIERQLRRADPLDQDLADSRSATGAIEQRLQATAVLHAVASLPQRQRLALLGTELEGRTRRQLAAELGLSEGAVRQLVYRARAQIRAAVAAVVPFAVIERAMRNSGWGARSVDPSTLRPAAEVMSATGMLAGGVAKLAAAAIAVGVVGDGLRGGGEHGHPHRLPASVHQITSALVIAPATFLPLRKSGPRSENEVTATRAALARRTDEPVAPPREDPLGDSPDERRAGETSTDTRPDGVAEPADAQRTGSESATAGGATDAWSPNGSTEQSASDGESRAATPSRQSEPSVPVGRPSPARAESAARAGSPGD